MFSKEIRDFRDKYKNREDFCLNISNNIYNIKQKYINEFMKNTLLDDEAKMEYTEKLKIQINNEINKFNKENEKLFEEKFLRELNLLSNQFMQNFTNSEIYENNSYQFFQDFETFRERAISSTPDFPRKNEILFDKILLIIKKFINSKMMKIKVINEEKNFIKEENLQQEEKINELSKEINIIKEKNSEYLNKLSEELIIEQKKNKTIEEKLSSILNNKTSEFESLQKEYNKRKKNYDQRLKELNDIKDKMKKELKLKEEQLLVMKMNNEKITSLYEQKSSFLEKEVSSWKNRYHNALIETKNKENDLKKENNKLKEQNKLLMKREKNNKENTTLNNSNKNDFNNSRKSLNNLATYVKKQLKEKSAKNIKGENAIKVKDKEGSSKNKGAQSNEERIHNYKDFYIKKNQEKSTEDGKEIKVRNIEEKLINLNQYKDKINVLKDFKCKFCFKSFSFLEYKQHFNLCPKNPMNSNNNNSSNKISKKNIIVNSNSGNYKRNNNSNSNSNINTNTNTNSNKNRRSPYSNKSNNRVINSNLNNNDINNKKQYININLENINDDFNNNTNNINYKINNSILNKNNFNNINIKINNQNININRNLININNIKKITNNIHLNNYLKNPNINNVQDNLVNNVSFHNIKHPDYNSHINSNNIRNNYSSSSLPNFNPKKLKIKIIKGRIRKDKTGKPYIEYIIELTYLTQKWHISKRFNQFTNLFKNLRMMASQIGEQLPQSANIFNNIGTIFSNLSHENKIIQLEKFLKDISEMEGINKIQLYHNFFETDQLFKQYYGTRNNTGGTNSKTAQNSNINDKLINKSSLSKNSNNSCLCHHHNIERNSNIIIDDKLEKSAKDISAPKISRRKEEYDKKRINKIFYETETPKNKEINTFKFQNRNSDN
jgi:hypothetical protein